MNNEMEKNEDNKKISEQCVDNNIHPVKSTNI
jgi:hypothetical protein